MPLWESTAIRIELSDILLIEIAVGAKDVKDFHVIDWTAFCVQLATLQTSAPSNLRWASFCHCQDDFALVLMEDAEGEVLSLTEEYPSNDHFQAWICVSDSSFTSCKPLAFRFCFLRVTKKNALMFEKGVCLIKSQVS